MTGSQQTCLLAIFIIVKMILGNLYTVFAENMRYIHNNYIANGIVANMQ